MTVLDHAHARPDHARPDHARPDTVVPDVRPGGDPAADLRRTALALAAQEHLWLPHVRFTHPRHTAALAGGRLGQPHGLGGEGWQAWLLTWLPGQSTGLHDHGPSSGAFVVLQGSVDETVLAREPFALDPFTGVELRTRTRRYRQGQVRTFDADHVHDVSAGPRPAVTLHVYAPELVTMTRYALLDGVLVATAQDRAGEDW